MVGIARASQCPVCRTDLVDAIGYCASCATPHHRTCFEWADGCAMYGCGGKVLSDHAPETGSATPINIESSPEARSERPPVRGTGHLQIPVTNLHSALGRKIYDHPEDFLLILLWGLTAFEIPGAICRHLGTGMIGTLVLTVMAYALTPSLTQVEMDAPRDSIMVRRRLLGIPLRRRIGCVSDITRIERVAHRRWLRDGGDLLDYALVVQLASGRSLRISPAVANPGDSAEARESSLWAAVQAATADVSRVVGLPVEPLRIDGDRRALDRGIWLVRLLSYLALAAFWASRWRM